MACAALVAGCGDGGSGGSPAGEARATARPAQEKVIRTEDSQEQARLKLGQLGLTYSPDGFVLSAFRGHVVAVRGYLDAGMNINVTSATVGKECRLRSEFRSAVWSDERVSTPLADDVTAVEMAVYGKGQSVVLLLLERRAKPGLQVVCAAAYVGDPAILAPIVKAYKEAQDPSDPYWESPIMANAAMQSGKVESLKCLLDAGYNPVLALQTAVSQKKPPFVKYLLGQRSELRIKDKVLNTELEAARILADVAESDEERGATKEIVDLLVAAGAR